MIRAGDTTALRALMDMRADVNASDVKGDVVLMFAQRAATEQTLRLFF